jgi:ElaB/YqjD/DUF883 family membrane-anchored ribosome-binding protein
MFGNKTPITTNGLADQAALSADHALLASRRMAQETLDGLSDSVQDFRDEARPAIARAGRQAHALSQHAMDALNLGSEHLQARARRMSDDTRSFVRHEPVKTVLIAAAAGAALMALLGFFSRYGRRD